MMERCISIANPEKALLFISPYPYRSFNLLCLINIDTRSIFPAAT
jgi:hypothetical protein